jgi:hypothetical protein
MRSTSSGSGLHNHFPRIVLIGTCRRVVPTGSPVRRLKGRFDVGEFRNICYTHVLDMFPDVSS